MASLLSHYRAMGSALLGTTPSPEMNFLIQTASFAASEAAMYLASVVESAVVESAVVSYLELFQTIAAPFITNT